MKEQLRLLRVSADIFRPLYGASMDDCFAYHLAKSQNEAYTGLRTTCKKRVVCPFCADRHARAQAGKITTAQSNWKKQGGNQLELTLTIRTQPGDDPSHAMERLNRAREHLMTHAPFKNFRIECGIEHYVRLFEWGCFNSYGDLAPGPHVHLLLFGRMSDEAVIEAWQEKLRDAWEKASEKVGLTSPDREHGLLLTLNRRTPQGNANYYCKSSRGSRTENPWKRDDQWRLVALAATGDRAAQIMLYRIGASMYGRRVYQYSSNFSDLLK